MNTVAKFISNSQPYPLYVGNMTQLVANGATSGVNQTPERIHFTKMNLARMQRWEKRIEISPDSFPEVSRIKESYKLLAITESWCGDAAHCLPVIQKICELSPKLELFTIWRDENPELMDAFLTNGARSIPKVIVFDSKHEVQFVWGPRPAPTQPLLTAYKSDENISHEDFTRSLQVWYNADKGKTLIKEWRSLISQLS